MESAGRCPRPRRRLPKAAPAGPPQSHMRWERHRFCGVRTSEHEKVECAPRVLFRARAFLLRAIFFEQPYARCCGLCACADFSLGAMVLGVMTGLLRRSGSHTPLGNFSSKRGNKNFYKGRGGKKYGIPGPKGARASAVPSPSGTAHGLGNERRGRLITLLPSRLLQAASSYAVCPTLECPI